MNIIETSEGYKVDGIFFIRVSSLLKEAGLLPAYFNGGNSLEFGTHVHKACELYDKGTLNFLTLDHALKPYVDQYIRFAHQMKTMTHIEQLFFSKRYGYAGRSDRIIENNIYDIKTGKPAKWHGVQLAFYKLLARENGIKIYNCYGLYLSDMDYKLKAYNKPEYMTVALSILNIKNFKEKNRG